MTGTALGAKEKTTRTITFKNKEHENFYQEYLPKCRYEDVYHKALVYCLGIDRDTREHINRIYDFKSGCVKTECLHEGWQTSGIPLKFWMMKRWKKRQRVSAIMAC